MAFVASYFDLFVGSGKEAFLLFDIKTVHAPVEYKADGEGSIQAVFSTFDMVDSDGDVLTRAAFTDGQKVPMVWAHDWSRPIGKGVIKTDPKRAIFDGQFFMDTTDGLDAYRTVKAMSDLQEFSWGFRILDAEQETRDGMPVRVITKAEVFEVSPVLVGANRETYTLALKDGLIDLKRRRLSRHQLEAVIATLQALMGEDDAEAEADGEAPDGKAADDDEAKAQWTAAYINNLPDASFAVILPGGETDGEGKTTPRSLRKLPHHGADGKLDMAHLRNAMSREPQADMPDGAHATAHAHLMRHAKDAGIGDAGKGGDLTLSELLARVHADLETTTARVHDLPDEEALAVKDDLGGLLRRLADARSELDAALKRASTTGELSPRELARRFSEIEAINGLVVAAGGPFGRNG